MLVKLSATSCTVWELKGVDFTYLINVAFKDVEQPHNVGVGVSLFSAGICSIRN